MESYGARMAYEKNIMTIWMWNVFEPSLQNGHLETMETHLANGVPTCSNQVGPIRIHSIHSLVCLVHMVIDSAHPRFMPVPAGHLCFRCRK
jgi:hypothetical protein